MATLPADEDIKFPTLAELLEECFDWYEGEERIVLANDSLCEQVEFLSTNILPPPLPPTIAPTAPTPPLIGPLVASLLASVDRLFFISHRVPGSGVTEWSLVRIALRDSLREYPNCIQDGQFLVDFYTCHPKDKAFNAVNQPYWLEYHPFRELPNPMRLRTTHLLRPSDNSPDYAASQDLRPFRQWICLLNSDTSIHGPFDFAVVNNRKTRDRVSHDAWGVLHKFGHLFTNQAPSLDLPEYSVHLRCFHTSFTCKSLSDRVDAYIAHPISLLSV